MYGSRRQGSRSVLGDLLGLDSSSFFRMPDTLGFELERTDTGYRIEVPVAGFRPEDINVTIEDRQLAIEGKNERRRFTRTVVLPEEIDADKIEAHVENGLLTLNMPLHEKMQPRRIDVRVGGGEMKQVSGTTAGGTSGGTVRSVSGETKADGTQTGQQQPQQARQ